MPITFTQADVHRDRAALIELNVEYVAWVLAEIEKHFGVPAESVVGMPAHEYVPTVIEKVCGASPPAGVFYLVSVDGELAGMGGLRGLGTAAEIKRIYFRPAFRGRGLGEAMLDRLLADAVAFGYDRVLLDSGPFMTAAHRVYERKGFVDCEAYPGVEVPEAFHARWRFMRRGL
jgi:GNAT superfamily N-acetyltransferase